MATLTLTGEYPFLQMLAKCSGVIVTGEHVLMRHLDAKTKSMILRQGHEFEKQG
jgi:hypothetical protein